MSSVTAGLSTENFTFELRALGASPEFEIVTHTVRKSGRVSIPSSNYKIAERLEEESRKRGVENAPVAPIKQGKLVLKLKSRRSENRGKFYGLSFVLFNFFFRFRKWRKGA